VTFSSLRGALLCRLLDKHVRMYYRSGTGAASYVPLCVNEIIIIIIFIKAFDLLRIMKRRLVLKHNVEAWR